MMAVLAALQWATPLSAVENQPGIASPNIVPGQAPDPHVQGRCMASFIFFMALSRSAIDGGIVPAHQVSYLETIAFAAGSASSTAVGVATSTTARERFPARSTTTIESRCSTPFFRPRTTTELSRPR